MFYVGQKVVCINDNWEFKNILKCPKLGDILTIREILFNRKKSGLYFNQIHNPIMNTNLGHIEPSFNSICFVPLESTFKKMTFEKVVELVETCEN